MDLLEKLIPPLLVAVFMFFLTRNQSKRDKREAQIKEQHLKLQSFHTKAVFILIDSNKLALDSLKKLKDEKGKALLNGELTAINKKVSEFKQEFETFIIEK